MRLDRRIGLFGYVFAEDLESIEAVGQVFAGGDDFSRSAVGVFDFLDLAAEPFEDLFVAKAGLSVSVEVDFDSQLAGFPVHASYFKMGFVYDN